MRKVNIMVDVPDVIYDNVVEPFKKSKKFSKLIQSLLEGYYKDDYIAMFVEGVLDEALAESRQSFENIMQSMKDSLAVVGMMESEASSMMKQGIEEVQAHTDKGTFSVDGFEGSGAEEVAVGLPAPKEEKRIVKEKEEDPELKNKIIELEQQNKKFSDDLSSVREMLEKLLSRGVSPNQVVKVNPVEEIKKSEPLPEIKELDFVGEDFSLPPSSKIVKHPVVKDTEEEIELFAEEEEDEGFDDDFLDGLLEGNMYSG